MARRERRRLRVHPGSHGDQGNLLHECEGIDTSEVFLLVSGIVGWGQHSNYNCAGWTQFNGPLSNLTEPVFQPLDDLTDVANLFAGVGWIPCNAQNATCVVVGATVFEPAHVFFVWKPKTADDVDWAQEHPGEWWSSKMGPIGAIILHRRGAMRGDPNYGTERAWFKRLGE